MKKALNSLLILFVALGILGSCSSVKNFNSQINVVKSEEQLKSDVDFVYKKLQKLHPRLYWYISKKDLDYKFDSLKSTLNAPMTSNEFFFKISPIVASIKQGHMRMYPITKRFTKKEDKALNKKGLAPLSQFSYEIFDNKFYIVKNNSADTSIKVGSEIVSINNIKPQEVIAKFENTYTSDGYNQTFFERGNCWMFPSFFYVHTGEMDSVKFELKYCDTIVNKTIVRGKSPIPKKTETTKKKTKLEIAQVNRLAKAVSKKKKLNGYNVQTKVYSKNLTFMGADSSIAVMKLNDFSRGNFKKFYRNSFKTLDSFNTKTLIIDLRDNPGGRLNEISNLYSYLTDSNFYFIDKLEITNRTSFALAGYSNGSPIIIKALSFTLGLPYLISRIAKVRKDDGKFYYALRDSKLKHPNKNSFKGKVYVLTNGGSFSASSIISSNLKGSKRAFFVGEETGGAYNGCVAGRMPAFTLPQSKLRIRIGLGAVIPYYKTGIDGRGIIPDIQIRPTLDDRIKGNDPELNWILDDIKGLHASK